MFWLRNKLCYTLLTKVLLSIHLMCLCFYKVRATSHKPDEIYGIIERLSPGTRKVELFGRPHNVQPNW